MLKKSDRIGRSCLRDNSIVVLKAGGRKSIRKERKVTAKYPSKENCALSARQKEGKRDIVLKAGGRRGGYRAAGLYFS